jgi:hypothetical protein
MQTKNALQRRARKPSQPPPPSTTLSSVPFSDESTHRPEQHKKDDFHGQGNSELLHATNHVHQGTHTIIHLGPVGSACSRYVERGWIGDYWLMIDEGPRVALMFSSLLANDAGKFLVILHIIRISTREHVYSRPLQFIFPLF